MRGPLGSGQGSSAVGNRNLIGLGTVAIRFEAVHFTYPGASQAALRSLSLSLASGELLAVVGPNGSGKSTVAALANGLRVPGEGRVVVDGLCTSEPASVWDIRARVGLVMQNPDNQIVGTVVEDDVAFGPENLGVPRGEIRDRVDRALETVGLTGEGRREPHLLSGGQKQRLAIAGALAMSPAYLVLDEPTAMLDTTGRADVLAVLDRLRDTGVGIMHITHHLADVAAADRVIVLKGGEIAFLGSPAQLMADTARLEGFGLVLPPVGVLASRLRALGAGVPATALSAEAIMEALWR